MTLSGDEPAPETARDYGPTDVAQGHGIWDQEENEKNRKSKKTGQKEEETKAVYLIQ